MTGVTSPRSPSSVRHSLNSLPSPNLSRSANKIHSLNKQKLAKFIISAEFDNKIGSVVKHQFPKKIPGFKENLSQVLPELMIPLNSEQKEIEDYNVFILYCDKLGKYNTLPDIDKEIMEESGLGLQHMSLHEISTIYEKSSDLDDILFFFNVTKKIESKTNERGAVIRSISIGTPLRNFIVFKHLITMAIQVYIHDPKISHLCSLYNVINNTDISIWSNYLKVNSHLHNILSLNYEFKNRIILSHFKNISTKDMNIQSVRYKDGTLQYYSSTKDEVSDESIFKKVPLNFSLDHPRSLIHSDLNVNLHILKFLLQLSSDLNSIDYKNLKIVIYSSSQTTDFLCQFILSLSNFFNGFNKIYFHNDKILYFPILDLYNWERIVEFDKHNKSSKIIGTNNLILKDSQDFYDFFYDLDDEILTRSENLQTYDVSISKTQDFMEVLERLVELQQDHLTTKITLQRFNIWQILKILNRELDMNHHEDNETTDGENNEFEDGTELNLKDYYLSRNKNLVIFEEFFEFQTIRLIDSLNEYLKIVNRRFRSENELIIGNLNAYEVDKLSKIYDFLVGYVSSTIEGHIDNFFYIVEIFPSITIKHSRELVYDVEVDLEEKSILHELFKPIFFNNMKIQSRVIKLYDALMKSSLRIIIEQRLNTFLIIALEEFIKKPKMNLRSLKGSIN